MPEPRALVALLSALVALACGAPPDGTVDLAGFSAVRNLSAELALAEIEFETRLIDFGTAAARAHLISGWGQDEVDGATFVWGVGESSELDFVVFEPRDIDVAARGRAFAWPGSPAQSVTVAVNGQEIDTLRLGKAIRRIRFRIPAESLQRGRNLLSLRYAYHRPPREVLAGAGDPRPLAVAWQVLRFGSGSPKTPQRPEARPEGLYLPVGSEVRYALRLPGESYLVYEGVDRQADGKRLRLEVRFDGAAGEARKRLVRGSAGAGAMHLPAHAPRLVEIRLAALADGAWPRRPSGVTVKGLALRSHPPADPAPGPTAPAEQSSRPNIIVYLVDTLRADHLGCYGYDKAISPNIDAFAGDAVVFESPLAQSSWTRSSVASIMTGLIPTAHGVHGREDALREEAVTLAEILRRAGYETAAFVTNRSVGGGFGFEQGFDTFEFFSSLKTAALYPKSDAVNREVFAWLDQRGEGPFFLYVHTMDPHAPYSPPAAIRSRFAPDVRQPRLSRVEQDAFAELLANIDGRFGPPDGRIRLGSVPWLQALHRGLITATPELIADLTALYDAEIAFNDRSFGVFLERLRAHSLYHDAVIVFVSDHGEELHDHGSWSHGSTLFQEQLRVPLILKLPGSAHRGRRVKGLAQHIDLAPTLADIVGLAGDDSFHGKSLLQQLRNSDLDGRGYSHLDLNGVRATSLVEGSYKVICGHPFGSACRVYDLTRDPRERVDLSASRPVLAAYLRAQLRAFHIAAPEVEAPSADIDPMVRERLEALGYL